MGRYRASNPRSSTIPNCTRTHSRMCACMRACVCVHACSRVCMCAGVQACCTPGWNRIVLDVTFLRRYSAAPVWDECRASLLLDPQRRRPLLMWQRLSRHPWLCPCRDRSVGRLFGSTVKRAPNIRIRWRPPSAHQAAAAAGRAIGAPHRYHRSAPSQCSTA